MGGDDSLADIWYNIGQVAIGIGDLNLAYQAFKVSVSRSPQHAESFNNLGVLELRKRNVPGAKSHFESASTHAPHLFEPWYNSALLDYNLGKYVRNF